MRDPNQRARLDIDLYIGCSPAAWNVPTIGADRNMSAVTVGPGTNGSCRWSTSNFSSHSARIVRSCACGLGEIGAIDPLDALRIDGPMTVTPPSDGGRVGGREDLHVVAALAQRTGEPEHLSLHATGHGEAVRTDHPDVHVAPRPAQPRRSGGAMPSAS